MADLDPSCSLALVEVRRGLQQRRLKVVLVALQGVHAHLWPHTGSEQVTVQAQSGNARHQGGNVQMHPAQSREAEEPWPECTMCSWACLHTSWPERSICSAAGHSAQRSKTECKLQL